MYILPQLLSYYIHDYNIMLVHMCTPTYVVQVAGKVCDVLPLVQLRFVLLGGTLVLLVSTAARLVTRARVALVPTAAALQ